MKFFYNNRVIIFDFNSKSIIGDFLNDKNHLIIVNIPNDLIDHKIQVAFKTNHGYKRKMNWNSRKNIGDILKTYLEEIDEIFNEI